MRDLRQGALFGEIALLYKTKRTASVKCKVESTVGALSEEHFLELLRNYPEIESYLN